MGEDNPLVSVLVTNYNYARYILYALNSIENQEYQDIEIIIGDDRSDDDSVEVIDNWIKNYSGKKKITFIKNKENEGVGKLSNKLLSYAKGFFFQQLDADDILLPGKINQQVDFFKNNTSACLVYGRAFLIDEFGVEDGEYFDRIGFDLKKMPSGRLFESLYKFNFISTSTTLVKTSSARQVGGYNEDLRLQDYYMWLQLARTGEIIYLPEVVSKYRIHKTSMTNDQDANAKLEQDVLRIKYQYYYDLDQEFKGVFRKNLRNSLPVFYKFSLPQRYYWSLLNLKINPGFKSLFYLIVICLQIPSGWFQKLKMQTELPAVDRFKIY